LERGVGYVQAARDLVVHQSVLRNWVKGFEADPQHSFPGHGQMKPEQLEIARLKCKNLYSTPRRVSDYGAHRGHTNDRPVHAFADKAGLA
jgi:transposase-like protein